MKNKKDCSLVVQLLKCNQSLDKEYISHKVDTVGSYKVVLSGMVLSIFLAYTLA